MKKLLLIPIIGLLSCNCDNKVKEKTYIVKVNYISNTMVTVPSDTLQIISIDNPRIYVDNTGVPTLISDRIFSPHATNVRSFQVLKVIE